MANITIDVNLNIPGLPEAFKSLADVLIAYAAETFKREREQAANAEQPGDVGETECKPETTTPATPEPQPEPQPEPPASTKAYTLEDIGRAGAVLVNEKGKLPELRGLLSKYSVQAITQLDPNDYNAFAEDMKALGADL